MKEGLRSSTLSNRERDKFGLIPENGDDATAGEGDKEKESYLISCSSGSFNDSVISSPERKVEMKGREFEHVECAKDDDAGVDLGDNREENAEADSDNVRDKVGKARRGRKRKKLASPKKGDDDNSDADKEKKRMPLITTNSNSSKDSVHSSSEQKVEERSGTEAVECSKDVDFAVEVGVNANDDADTNEDTRKLGQRWQGRKRKNMEGPKSDDATSEGVKDEAGLPSISNGLDSGDKEKGSSLISGRSVLFNESANSSPERKVEKKGRECEYVECGKGADANVDLGSSPCAGANCDDNAEADTNRGRDKLGKARRGRKRKNVESSKKGDDDNSDADKEKKRLALITNYLNSAEESIHSSPEIKGEEERSGTEHVECSKNVDIGVEVGVDANDDTTAHADTKEDTPKLGKRRRGRKRKNVKGPKKTDDATGEGVKDEGGLPLISTGLDSVKDSYVSTLEIKVEEERSGCELVECSKDADASFDIGANPDGAANSNSDTEKGTHKLGKGRRGRKRKKVESSECNEGDRAGRKKVMDGKAHVIGRVLRSNTKAMRGGEKVSGLNGGVVAGKIYKAADQSDKKMIDPEKYGSTRPVGRPRKKIKGRRGRPPKLQGRSGASEVSFKEKLKGMGFRKKFPKVQKKVGAPEVICDEELKVMGSKKNSDQPKGEDTAEDGRHNKLTRRLHYRGKSVTGKQLKMHKHNKKEEMGRREQQQLVREKIVGILMKAGWTIQHRPRQSREYTDSVYVDCEGKTYWSVTLAYRTLKKKVEDGDADHKTISAFTPIPEEVLSTLFRVRRVIKEKKKKPKQQGQGGSKTDKGIPGEESSKNEPATKSIGGSKRKGKLNSAIRPGNKSSSIKMKGDTSHCEQDYSAGLSRRGMPRLNKGERKNRKPCALLARSSVKGSDQVSDGFVLYDGKRSLLSWMIDLGTVPPGGKVQYMNHSSTKAKLEGWITRDGIHCCCCNEVLTILDFESHAGSKLCQPFNNICLESGVPLQQCLVDSWSKQVESDQIGFQFLDIDGNDPNDDTCNICGDGGDLICCDGCPSTFHQSCLDIQKCPSGYWHCVYCSCKFCGMVAGNASQRDDNHDTLASEMLTCRLCEEKFHQLCIQGKDTINVDSNCTSFCGRKCEEVLLGVKHELEEGFSWTLLQHSDVSRDNSLSGAPLNVECNAKLAVAFSIMDECFLPIVDERSGINMIHNVVYSCGSNFSRLNYSGFFTAILERGDEIISAASIRIHGSQLAEMPFIGTRNMYRRQGMCRRLLNAIESALCSLDVEKLVIPAISELLQTWTSVFGFKPLEETKRKEMRCMSMIVFPGTDMLQKSLLKNQFAIGNTTPAAVVKSDALRTEHETMHEGLNNSGMGCSAGSDSNASPVGIVQHAHGINDEIAVVESGLHLSDGYLNATSNMISGTVDLRESAANETCIAHLSKSRANKLVTDLVGSTYDAYEPDRQRTLEGRNKCTDAQAGSTSVLPGEKGVECNSKFGSTHDAPEPDGQQTLEGMNRFMDAQAGSTSVLPGEKSVVNAPELDGQQTLEGLNRCMDAQAGSTSVLRGEKAVVNAPELDGQQTLEGMNRCTDAQAGSIDVLTGEEAVECNSELNHQSICGVENKSSMVSEIGCDTIIHAIEEGKEAVECVQMREVKYVKHDCNFPDENSMHRSATHPQYVDLVDGFQLSGEKIVCQGSKATTTMFSDAKNEIQLHHNSHGVMVHATSPSHQRRQDVANDSDAPFLDDGNPNSSCERDVLETHEIKGVDSVDSKQLPISGAFPVATTGPDSLASCMGYGLCKSLELPCVDNDDIPGVEASSLTCPMGVSHAPSCEVTGNIIHVPEEELTVVQTDSHSLDRDSLPNMPQLFSKSSEQSESGSQVDHTSVTICDSKPLCNSSSCPDVTRLCTSSSCNECGIPEVGSCRLLKSGKLR